MEEEEEEVEDEEEDVFANSVTVTLCTNSTLHCVLLKESPGATTIHGGKCQEIVNLMATVAVAGRPEGDATDGQAEDSPAMRHDGTADGRFGNGTIIMDWWRVVSGWVGAKED